MSWVQRLFGGDTISQPDGDKTDSATEENMSPGLTGEYDWDLREKAGMRQPPVPPQNMGLEGEYDSNGLAKRVAAAFDEIKELENIETISIAQDGCTIMLNGSVPSEAILVRMIDAASKVDGTKSVDSSGVKIEAVSTV